MTQFRFKNFWLRYLFLFFLFLNYIIINLVISETRSLSKPSRSAGIHAIKFPFWLCFTCRIIFFLFFSWFLGSNGSKWFWGGSWNGARIYWRKNGHGKHRLPRNRSKQSPWSKNSRKSLINQKGLHVSDILLVIYIYICIGYRDLRKTEKEFQPGICESWVWFVLCLGWEYMLSSVVIKYY